MFQVQCLQSTDFYTEKGATGFYSKYSIGPFIQGQGITVGNALRRVLLSNLKGLSIIGVRIAGISHEFSTILNVKEDVVDILLNLKQIILKGSIKSTNKLVLARLNRKEAGIITANDIELPNNISLVDSRQYIASLTNEGDLKMEFLIAQGQNYVTSGKTSYTLPEGFLAIDAIFMPVTKVNFFVEPSQTNSSSELESLIFEIWTNGSIKPAEALSMSAEILENTFGILKIVETSSIPVTTPDTPVIDEKAEHFKTILIEELELSVRAYNCLKRANVHTLSDLLQYSAEDLLKFKNFGQKSTAAVCESLKQRFDMDLRK